MRVFVKVWFSHGPDSVVVGIWQGAVPRGKEVKIRRIEKEGGEMNKGRKDKANDKNSDEAQVCRMVRMIGFIIKFTIAYLGTSCKRRSGCRMALR